ncbi:TIGR04283 family arsenosugar biosynthesis glycosyltransferase [Abditibacterium utsteinense]|nr:TIGR04283 family arsenosugar biosynthesis glycosyltransferase [Abditibacterium utsteinense]
MISVVIPARNEAQHLPRLISRLRSMPEIGEIWVSDGGSRDETVAISQKMKAHVVEGARGRGAQQNAAAQLASGEVLWFLHADALPSLSCGRQIEAKIKRGALGGNFRLVFAARGAYARLFEKIARVQRRFGVYYGDSGIFVTRRTWQEIGEFAPWPLFEDLDFVRRLEKLSQTRGQKTACCAGRLRTSARRFQKSPARVLALWFLLQVGFELGVSPEKLADYYHRGANRKKAR